ncbi:hypothetical protein BDZ89DRAFT_343639 [Hymenopellis radicata]|nr:hypothetical protein BDZ89DRAFT_343639 [Hymenopellis radicata]
MPKASSSTADAGRKTRFVVITDRDANRRVLLPRNQLAVSYDEALGLIHRHFTHISETRMLLSTHELEECQGEDVEIPSDSWESVLPLVSNISVSENLAIPQKERVYSRASR